MNFCLEEFAQAVAQGTVFAAQVRALLADTLTFLALDTSSLAQFLHHFFNLADADLVLLEFVEHFQLGSRVVQCQQGTCVAHVNLFLLECHLDGGWQLQQTQVVGYCGTVLAYLVAQLFLCQIVLLHQVLVGQGNLQCTQVLTLNVLYQCHLHHVLVVNRPDVGGNVGESCSLAGSPTSFTGDDDVGVVTHVAQGDGLYDAYLSDTVGQFL